MKERLRLMCVLAHPDDESLGMGGTLAKYAAEGIETYLVTATRGERGWFGDEKEYPGLEALGKIREAELLNAARELGIREVKFLDYTDGDLDQANPAEATAKIVSHLRHVRPQVVITFDPNGAYGHDNIPGCPTILCDVRMRDVPVDHTQQVESCDMRLLSKRWASNRRCQ